jgi:hypothetical protein
MKITALCTNADAVHALAVQAHHWPCNASIMADAKLRLGGAQCLVVKPWAHLALIKLSTWQHLQQVCQEVKHHLAWPVTSGQEDIRCLLSVEVACTKHIAEIQHGMDNGLSGVIAKVTVTTSFIRYGKKDHC